MALPRPCAVACAAALCAALLAGAAAERVLATRSAARPGARAKASADPAGPPPRRGRLGAPVVATMLLSAMGSAMGAADAQTPAVDAMASGLDRAGAEPLFEQDKTVRGRLTDADGPNPLQVGKLGPADAPRSLQGVDDDLLAAARDLLQEQDGLWVSKKLRFAHLGADRGVGLVAEAPIAKGEALMEGTMSFPAALEGRLRHPWEGDVFSEFLDAEADKIYPDKPGRGRMALKLANLLLQIGSRGGEELSALERYLLACSHKAGAFYQWPEDVRDLLRGSYYHAFAEQLLDDEKKQVRALLRLWPESLPTPSFDELMDTWLRARALQLTRAFGGYTFGSKLVPVLDLLNHAQPPHNNAQYQFHQNQTRWELEATTHIAAGDEVLVAYQSDKSFLHMWWNYGFFDESAPKHEVPIVVWDGQARDAKPYHTYWVPDESSSLEETDLFRELKDYAMRQMEQSAGSARRQALRRMDELIRLHMTGYPPNAGADDAEDPRQGNPDRWERERKAAREVARYELTLLRGALARLEELSKGGPSDGSEF